TDFAKQYGDKFEMTRDPMVAAKSADVVITDVWASMGQEEEKAIREAVFKSFKIDDQLMSVAKQDAMVLHCLPAHREEEISADVFEAHAKEIFEEAENRLHAQKAVMVKLMS
ncbi:MAG: ornithine carbamoyltransferase, partial [bacterium]|nr:ornithine carbamoyltransferase [bacterium]